MAFFKFEQDNLLEFFPEKKATLEEDFTGDELKAMQNLGVLKGSPYLYLSNIYSLFFF